MLTLVYMGQNLWTKTFAPDKQPKIAHKIGVKKKDTAYILIKSKISSVHFAENLKKKNLPIVDFSYLQNSVGVFFFFFFDTNGNCDLTQFFLILENFGIPKTIERLGKNPNFKKQKENYRLNLDMHF